ncbi:tRNA (adenine-N1)-methyltransferase [Stomatohabitans albus]|uniref:tRNA (adenine-N1)-methyltransferase n=1 Tax=Stomatohabitans albus TaxID=3110766 RepID=UPI00300CF8DF
MKRFAGHHDLFSPGDTVLLTDRKDRRFMFDLQAGGEFHFHRGIIKHDQLLGQPEGITVRSTMHEPMTAVRPTSADYVLKSPRGAQIIYPKDQAMMVAEGDIGPGMTVVEAGAGSGGLTLALLRAVGPTGRVISFERREDHAAVCIANIERRLGERPTNWELIQSDLADGLATVSCDRICLDMLEPWEHIDAAAQALHPGGIMVVYTPAITQVMRVYEAIADDARWGHARTTETLVRTWKVDGLAVRSPTHH